MTVIRIDRRDNNKQEYRSMSFWIDDSRQTCIEIKNGIVFEFDDGYQLLDDSSQEMNWLYREKLLRLRAVPLDYEKYKQEKLERKTEKMDELLYMYCPDCNIKCHVWTTPEGTEILPTHCHKCGKKGIIKMGE